MKVDLVSQAVLKFDLDRLIIRMAKIYFFKKKIINPSSPNGIGGSYIGQIYLRVVMSNRTPTKSAHGVPKNGQP